MLAIVHSGALHGVRGRPVAVEVHVAQGLPGFTIVGLPDVSCREARDRVRAAIQSSGFDWPMQRITVNLAPSGFRKVGAGMDLAIAVGILIASKQLKQATAEGIGFLAELGLDGSLRRVAGTLPMVASLDQPTAVVSPLAHAEAALVDTVDIRPAPDLRTVVHALRGEEPWPDPPPRIPPRPPDLEVDLAEVRGQPLARFAIEVAASGGHHVLLTGAPGAGKTMLSRALVGLLPPLDGRLALDVTTIHSAAGLALPPSGLVTQPPFRAPHHTSSMISLVGGGTAVLRPGEVSCAHGGVLFLDELAEFPSSVLDALRQPLEDGRVRVARAVGAADYPARFLLVGAMNPCPCGEFGDPTRCACTEAAVLRYQRRVSGPLMDRFDIRLHVSVPSPQEILESATAEATAVVAERVAAARQRAARRGARVNVQLSPPLLDQVAPLTPDARTLLEDAISNRRLSARGVHRVRTVARTIADLADSDSVGLDHLRQALLLRAGGSAVGDAGGFHAA